MYNVLLGCGPYTLKIYILKNGRHLHVKNYLNHGINGCGNNKVQIF